MILKKARRKTSFKKWGAASRTWKKELKKGTHYGKRYKDKFKIMRT